jgi:hypothetical protein
MEMYFKKFGGEFMKCLFILSLYGGVYNNESKFCSTFLAQWLNVDERCFMLLLNSLGCKSVAPLLFNLQLNNSYSVPFLIKQPATWKPTIVFWIPGHNPWSFLIWNIISEKANISISRDCSIYLIWGSHSLVQKFFHLLKCDLMFVDACITVQFIKKNPTRFNNVSKVLLFHSYIKLKIFRATHRPS